MKVKSFHVEEGEDRESRWALVQYDNGSLKVNFEDRLHNGNLEAFIWSIDHFMRVESPARAPLQALVDRMFKDA